MSNLQKNYTLNNLINKNLLIPILFVVLIIIAILSIALGAVNISIKDVITAVFSNNHKDFNYQIINYVRIPRVLAAILVGSALSVSGCILQSILKNPLASPNIIGINSGAGLFTIIASVVFPYSFMALPIASFMGALFASLLVCFIAFKTSASRLTIIVGGIAVSNLLSAGIDLVIILKNETVLSRINFIVGGFSAVSFRDIKFSGIVIIICIFIALLLSYEVDVMGLGDDVAKSLGLNVKLYRFVYIVLVAMLAGSAVSIAGLIGFVGLIVPNLSRYIVGNRSRILIPTSMLVGAIVTLVCDTVSRIIFAPYEVPVGIVLSFLGTPFFIHQIFTQNRGFKNARI